MKNITTNKWYKSLSFQGIMMLALITFWLLVGIIFIMNTLGKEPISFETSKFIEQLGNNVVSKLTTRSKEIAALTRTLAVTAENLPKSENAFNKTIPKLIDFQRDLEIAGGGVWPEPYTFQADRKKRSFFWGRNAQGHLLYYDDYNQSEPGYHHEEWYVAVRHMKPGTCSWSESYMDPYSYQPMVTCTVATFEQRTFSGTVTIDLKLEGLQAIIESFQKKTGGYIFLLDRNNKFITFPKPTLVKQISQDTQGHQTENFIFASELAQKFDQFAPLSAALTKMNQFILTQARQMPDYDFKIATEIEQDSYQINQQQAELLAAMIANPIQMETSQSKLYQQVILADDFLLQEAATSFIFHVPETYWKLVIVKSNYEMNAVAEHIIQILIIYVVITTLLILVISYFVLNRYLINPLLETIHAVQNIGMSVINKKQLKTSQIKPTGFNEIDRLTQVFVAISIENARVYDELAQLTQAYERFVPREFLNQLDKKSVIEVKLGDQIQQEMTILFSDIRSFTSLSEQMTPQDNFDFINAYLSRMQPVISQHFGFIDKYIGDAIMALFPTNADDAVQAAIAMLKRLTEYNLTRGRPDRPILSIGIGINTGLLMLGTVGGQQRMDGTVISDAVNVASRIEELTKIYGTSLLITEQTYQQLSDHSHYKIRVIDRVTVKGKTEPITVYEVFDAQSAAMIELKLTTLADFEQGFNYFHQEQFEQAQHLFEKVRQINPDDNAAQVYSEHCRKVLGFLMPEKPIILMVDDMLDNLKILSEFLTTHFELLMAEDGQTALEMAELNHPHLILLDVMMPGINGFKVCERLKANPKTQDIPVIFMTALSDTVNQVKGFKLGAVDYITKPLQRQEVLSRIKTHLNISHLQKQLQARSMELEIHNLKLKEKINTLAAQSQLKYSFVEGR